ncbi:sphingomyelin phosphodiesterase [Hypoxylon sp. FL1150]|nr:sphingomyelin phosphodiesterase [Hypoxylon sp. FL1150]
MRLLPFVLAGLAAGRGVVAASSNFVLDDDDGSQKVLTPPPTTEKVWRHSTDLAALAATVRADAQSPASCAACETIIFYLKIAAARGDDFFVRVVTELCKRIGVQDDDVCEGSIALEGPIIAHGLRGMVIGSRTSRLACTTFMGLCSYPEVKTYNVSFPSPKPNSKRPAPSGLKPLHVVHFSDIHIDPLYVEGADAHCSKPICCREYADADKAGNADSPAGPNGEHTCDSPVSLEDSMYAAIREIVPDAAFSIFTGDIVDHAVWDTSESQNAAGIVDAYDRMSRAGLTVHGTAGNHEASPANSFPPTATVNGTWFSNPSQWLYDLLASTWAQWNGAAAAATTRDFGAYSTKYVSEVGSDGIGGKLRIISLSTNMYYAHNYWLYEEPMETDPSGQFAWLVAELDDAEKQGERVYVTGHMPMGARDAFHDASNYFDQIVNRYEGTIAAMFFGHTHFDEFELSYSNYENRTHANALAMSYIGPSLTPMSGHPAFRVYAVDPVTFAVLDTVTYIANTSDPSFHSPQGPTWTKYYSAKEAYGPLVAQAGLGDDEELTPAFWHNVTEVLEANATAFDEFLARRKRGWNVDVCVDECKSTEICKLRSARAQDNCMRPSLPGVSAKGEEQEEQEEEECGRSVVRDTLGSMVVDPVMLEAFGEIVARAQSEAFG